MATTFNIAIVVIAVFIVESVLCDLNLLLLHNNNIQSQFKKTSEFSSICENENNCYEGLAKVIKTVHNIKDEEKGKRKVIFLNAGANFQGSRFYSLFKWKEVANFIDRLELDAMSLSNIEFEDGVNGLVPFLENISTVVVASNIDISNEPSLKLPNLVPYKILEINGTKIAVIGYTTPSTKILPKVGNVKFLDVIESVKRQVDVLKNNTDVKIFIALGHSEFNVDSQIAEEILDIDLVVSGHTNTFPNNDIPIDSYPKIVIQTSGKKVPVVQSNAFTNLGSLKIDFNDEGDLVQFEGHPIYLDNTFEEDDNFLEELKPWQTKVRKVSKHVLGETKVVLDAHNYACKLHECNIGDVIADAIVDMNARTHKGAGWTDAPIAFIEAGSIKTSIDATHRKGKISYSDVLAVLPSKDHIVKGTIKGKFLHDVFLNAVHRYEKTKTERVGEFLQVSGVQIEYSISKKRNARVKSLKVRCGKCDVPTYAPIEADKEYTILTTSNLAKGGDTYSVLKKNLRHIKKLSVTTTQAMARYIKSKTPIYPIITNRITFKKPSRSLSE